VTTLQLIGVGILAWFGFLAACVLFLAVGASVIRRDKEVHEDRMAIRERLP